MDQDLTLDAALAHISADKRAALEPVLTETFGFYGSIAMGTTTELCSAFTRDVLFVTPPIARPRVLLSPHGHVEAGLVHELLHLYHPLRSGVYALYFPNLTPLLSELADFIQNVVEHDLMMEQFLSFGYAQEDFLASARLNIDYRREKQLENGPPYWLYEYLRHLFMLRHLPPARKESVRASMASVRKLALQKYPGLLPQFQWVRDWVERGDFHYPHRYARELADLFAVFKMGTPERYMKPEAAGALSIHSI